MPETTCLGGKQGLSSTATGALVLGVLLFTGVVFSPREAGAIFGYGAQVSYQQNETNNGANSSTTSQERFSAVFNLISKPNSKLSMTGMLRFDVIQSNRADGSGSTDLQPNVDVSISTNYVKMLLGYRELLRDEDIILVNKTDTLSTDSQDMFGDISFTRGRLPSLRLRYSMRNQKQDRSGVVTSDSNTRDLQGSIFYRLGIFAFNADYRTQQSEDNITGVVRDSQQVAGQVSVTKRFGTRLDTGLRESYNQSTGSTDGQTDSKQYTSVSEAKVTYRLLKNAVVSSSYIYRVSDDLLKTGGPATENTWFTSAVYSFPKLFRFYGSYLTRTNDVDVKSVTNQTAVGGVNFSHTFKGISISSRYERRVNTDSTEQGGTTTDQQNSQDNIDWVITARPGRFLGVLLSEAYVKSANDVSENTNNRFRLKLDLGPVKNLTSGPYIDYNIATASDGRQTTTTEIVLPASYRIALRRKVDITFSDSYRIGKVDTEGDTTTTQSNNAIIRLNLSNPLPGFSLSGDASFQTTSNETIVTNTSSYTLRASWTKTPHILNANFRYQTGSNTASSIGFAAQYGLTLRLKKLSTAFQARYDYSTVLTQTNNFSQGIYFLLSVRK